MKASQITEITEKVKELLQKQGSHYFNVDVSEDVTVKIRVSDHSANRGNNGDRLTLSFVSARCDQGYKRMTNEWLVSDIEDMLTDTYEYVSEILEWELEQAL